MSEWGRGYDQGHAEAEKVYKPTIAALEQRVREAEEARRREFELREETIAQLAATEREAAALREENERLKEQVAGLQVDLDVAENPIYCIKCGSCGEEGCCPAERCMYPGYAAEAYKAERDALRLRLAECEGALEALVDRCMELNLSECEPALGRARDALSSSPPSPVSALIEVGRLAVHLVEKIKHKATGGFAPDAYEEWDELYDACVAIIAKEKSDG